jgi:hypothetical protein
VLLFLRADDGSTGSDDANDTETMIIDTTLRTRTTEIRAMIKVVCFSIL